MNMRYVIVSVVKVEAGEFSKSDGKITLGY